MRRIFAWLFLVCIAGGVVFYGLTRPHPVDSTALPQHTPNRANGEYIFNVAGCASCHAAPARDKCDNPKSRAPKELVGGRCFKTPFGIFHTPNISPDRETGIGGWTNLEFINAVSRGISPNGEHYYPVFPYSSYQRMTIPDLLDLKMFLDSLPAKTSRVPDHQMKWPFRMRRALGLWKWLYIDEKPFTGDPTKSAAINRGAYLVEGPGHCGECHSPRTLFGGIRKDAKLSGARAPEGDGYSPNLTPHKDGLGSWSEDDISYLLETGFTPDFDVIGDTMVAVQDNMAKLTEEDRAAIAAYLKSLPALKSTEKAR